MTHPQTDEEAFRKALDEAFGTSVLLDGSTFIAILRHLGRAGFAAVFFTPDEIGPPIDREDLENHMVDAGMQFIRANTDAPATRIQKSSLTISFLHEAADNLADWSTEQIIREIDEGQFVGRVSPITTINVPDENVAIELQALGNDGTFFDEVDA